MWRDDEDYDRLGVQLAEARRMALDGGVPRARLSLLLIDNAAEVLLRQVASTHLEWADGYSNMLNNVMRSVRDQNDPEFVRIVEEISSHTVSKTKRKNIHGNFDHLVDFVVENGKDKLSVTWAAAIKVLHRYRNAAQHQDRVRPDVIMPAVRIYFFLVCELLRQSWMNGAIGSSAPTPDGVQEVLEGESDRADWRSLETRVADRLERDLHIETADVAAVLAEHLIARVSALYDAVDVIAQHFGYFEVFEVANVARIFTIRVLQLGEEEWQASEPPEDIWTRGQAIDGYTINRWRSEAGDLAESEDPLEALVTFAGLDDKISVLEVPAAKIIDQIERQLDRDEDFRRGR